MRKKLILIISTLILIFVIALTTQSQNQTSIQTISRQQMNAQVTFFNNALGEFGATTPDQAVSLWIKGDQTRNGVYKYSVSCDELKQWLIERWGEPEKSFWIIGGSSPWLTEYEILNKSDISPTEIQYVVQYHWATSAGPEPTSTEELLIKKINEKWCVNSVELIDGHRYY